MEFSFFHVFSCIAAPNRIAVKAWKLSNKFAVSPRIGDKVVARYNSVDQDDMAQD